MQISAPSKGGNDNIKYIKTTINHDNSPFVNTYELRVIC